MASSMPQTCIDNCWLGHCSPLPRWKLIIASFHPLEGSCEKIGRASLLASHRPSKSLPHEARREPRPPGSSDGRFERLTIPSLHPCRRYLTQWSAAHDLSSESLTGLRSFSERSAAKTTRWLSNAISKLVKGIASPLRRLSTKAWNCGW